MTKPVDQLSAGELSETVVASASQIREREERQARALGVGQDRGAAHEQITSQTSATVADASSSAIDADDYKHHARTPSLPATESAFESIFNDSKRAFMSIVSENMNIATRAALDTAIEAVGDLESLSGQIANEATKIKVAYAAGLLTPPTRAGVQELREQTQVVHRETSSAITDLEAAAARRRAARRYDDGDGDLSVPASRDQNVDPRPVRGRFLEDMGGRTETSTRDPSNVELTVFSASEGASGLGSQARAPGLASRTTRTAASDLRQGTLDKIGYLAICLSMSQLNSSVGHTRRAERALERLTAVIDMVMRSFDNGFLTVLQLGMQELANDALRQIRNDLQNRLDSFDVWLSLQFPTPGPLITTVQRLGQRASEKPILDALASKCGLSMESFCDFQGLLEIAAALENELGFNAIRPPAIGRARLILEAPLPEAGDSQAQLARPDSEALLVLSERVAPGAVLIRARVPAEAQARRLAAGDAAAHRDDFSSVYEPSPAIGGGPGTMALEGDDESREVFEYSSSTFDPESGVYEFELQDPAAGEHRPLALGRPLSPDRTLLFRSQETGVAARRFNLAQGSGISVITDPLDPAFDFASEVAVGDPLYVGQDPVPALVTLVSAGSLTLNSAHFAPGPGATLARAGPIVAPGDVVLARMRGRPLKDLGLVGIGPGEWVDLDGRIVVDAGDSGHRRISRQDGVVAGDGTSLTTAAPMFRADDVGASLEIDNFVAGTPPTTQRVTVTITSVTNQGRTAHFAGGTATAASHRSFTLRRVTTESLDFHRVTCVEPGLYSFELDTACVYTHAIQGVEVPATAQVIPGDLAAFPASPDPGVSARFDPDLVPPGSVTLRAVFESPTQALILGPIISLSGGTAYVRGDQRAYASAAVDPQDSRRYVFTLSEPTTGVYAAGDVVEVETTSVLDQLQANFPTGWSASLDAWLRGVGEGLKVLHAKFCRLLQGRPEDMDATLSAVIASSITASGLLTVIRIVLEGIRLGLPSDPRIEGLAQTLRVSGMNAAAQAFESGNVEAVSRMTPIEATSEGQALQAMAAYRETLTLTSQVQRADAIANALRGEENNKRLLAGYRQGFNKAAESEINKRLTAARVLEQEAREIT